MAVERKWFRERIASPADAEGRRCVFCGELIRNESQPEYWALKAVEDNQDADFIVEEGYAHRTCARERQAGEGRGRFALPDVPEGPRRP